MIEIRSPTLQADSLISEPRGKPLILWYNYPKYNKNKQIASPKYIHSLLKWRILFNLSYFFFIHHTYDTWIEIWLLFNSVQSLSLVWLSTAPWTATRQASLSITNSQSLLKLISIKSVMPSNHLFLCHPLLLLPSIFPRIRVFLVSQVFTLGDQSIGVSTSALVLPMNIQDWFPLG